MGATGISGLIEVIRPRRSSRLSTECLPARSRANWGIKDQNPDPPTNVDYLVLDTRLNVDSLPVLTRLLGPGGGFQVTYRAGSVLVAKRTNR